MVRPVPLARSRLIRTLAVFLGVFAGVVAVLLAAVGQLGRVDRQTLVVVLAAAAVTAAVATAQSIKRRKIDRR